MSYKFLPVAWEAKIDPTLKLVLLSLADQANDEGLCWPSISNIMARTCLCERAVQNALAKLETIGYFRRVFRAGASTHYLLNSKATPAVECTPAPHAPPPPHHVHPTPAPRAPRTVSEPSMNRKPKTNAPAFDAVAALSGLGVEKDLAEEWLAVRRKKRATAVTQRVIDAVIREAGLASMTVEQAISKCCERGWQTFDHAYVAPNGHAQFKSEKQRNMEASMKAIYGPKAPAQTEKLITGEIV